MFFLHLSDVAIALTPAREMKHFSNIESFSAYSLAILSTRKHLVSRFWLPTTAVWRTRRLHTPHQEHLQFRGNEILCEKL